MRIEKLLWIPIIGIFAMIKLTNLKYSAKYFAGFFWTPYQGVCFGGALIILASNFL